MHSDGADPGPDATTNPDAAPASSSGTSEPHPELPEPPEGETLSLDPRVVAYWRVSSLIGSILLLAILFFGGGSLALNVPQLTPYIAALWCLILLFRAWMLWWHPRRSFLAWSYRVDDRVIEIRRGIWFRSITLLPLSRLQHVDLNRGPIERSFGLATLILFTAGTQHASIPLPGLEAVGAAALRDRLVAAGGDDAV